MPKDDKIFPGIQSQDFCSCLIMQRLKNSALLKVICDYGRNQKKQGLTSSEDIFSANLQ